MAPRGGRGGSEKQVAKKTLNSGKVPGKFDHFGSPNRSNINEQIYAKIDLNIDAFQDRDALALANPNPTGVSALLQHSRLYCSAYMPWARFQSGLNQEMSVNQDGETVQRVLMPGIPTGENAAARLEEIDQIIDLSRVPIDDYIENLEKMRTQAEARGASMEAPWQSH